MHDSKKSRSVISDIAFYHNAKTIGSFLVSDFIAVVISFVGWFFTVENVSGTLFDFTVSRFLDSRLIYHIVDEQQQEFTFRFSDQMIFAIAFLVILLAFQIVIFFVMAKREDSYIRQVLSPIDEIALAAEKLSSTDFDESKLRDIENAIDSIENVSSYTSIEVDDSDLDGLEAAVNNMLARLHDSYRAQARFVDDASHELRTPIAVIKGYSEMLCRWGKDDQSVLEESVNAIKSEAENMQRLVDNLLFLARGEMGRQKFDLKIVSLDRMMEDIQQEFDMIDKKNNYRLQVVDRIDAMIDEPMMKQAIRILAENGAKYTPDGGLVTLRCFLNEDGEPVLEVQDNGCGIKKDDIPHIFERFYRSDLARSTVKGSGLGLSIAKWIVDQHEGRFDVMSYENVGTRISIILPKSSISYECVADT